MKRILSCMPNLGRGKFLLPAVLGLFTLGTGPGSQACGPYVATLHCPVAGPGKDFQPDGCPGGYCGRKVAMKGPGFDWKGGKIHFCCSGCPEVFKKSPEKFAANANLQLVASRQTKQVSCPLCGGALKNPVMAMIADVDVLVCSAECKKKLDQAKPAERL